MQYPLVALAHSPTTFSYEAKEEVRAGDLVAVPFRNKYLHGIVLAVDDVAPPHPTKSVEKIIRKKVLTGWQVALVAWMIAEYRAHAGKTLRLFVPERVMNDAPLKRKIKDPAAIAPSERKEFELNDAQKLALEKISPPAPLNKGKVNCAAREGALGQGDPAKRDGGIFLLHGITGSGKTEVYLQAILEEIKKGKQALLLVPEIALTPQLVGYFAAVIPSEKIAIIHSHLAEGQRLASWEKIKSGETQLVIGSRSALFSPLEDVGIIILDEEHEWTYKNEQNPRYHTRAVAQKMAELTGSKLVLGSATPSLESYAAAQTGQMKVLELPARANESPLPPVRVVDMRQELKKENYSPFSELLTEKIKDRLAKKEQIVLLLNKRGLAGSLVCRDCGAAVECTSCAVPMSLHGMGGREQLVCHFCGKITAPPTTCPSCGSLRIKTLGAGTQKIEADIATHFPSARVIRADRDSTTLVGSHQRIFDDFKAGKADILLGTQMVAKGLDVANVTLVGVLLADIGLHLPDFRASEKTFSLLTQVAGRAGRAAKGGEVIVQTYSPEHPAIRAAAQHDYVGFFREEIKDRRALAYPPFTRIVKFIFVDAHEKTAREAAQAFALSLRGESAANDVAIPETLGSPRSTHASLAMTKDTISVAPALVSRQHDKYHWHVIWRGQDVAALFENLDIPDGCRVDVDPMQVV